MPNDFGMQPKQGKSEGFDIKLCASFQTYWNSNCSYNPETLNLGQNWQFSVLCDLEIWWMTLAYNRAPLLCYVNVNHFKAIGEFKLEWQTRNAQFCQNQRYLSLVTLKFHGWHWKIIGHLFYPTSRFERRFIAICEFELELQSEKSQFLVKIDIF